MWLCVVEFMFSHKGLQKASALVFPSGSADCFRTSVCLQGSVKRVSITIPHKETRETSNMVSASLTNPRAGPLNPAPAVQKPTSFIPPVRPVANPTAGLAANPSQPGYASAGFSQPSDPRRAAVVKSANPALATQIGQYPGPAAASGSGQYPMASSGLGAGGLSGQYGAALPADPRQDPRKAARSTSSFTPAAGFPGEHFLFSLYFWVT